jgi:hypothetical protein
MSDSDKFALVREVLLKDWDPIDIGYNPNLSAEYDHYIPGIVSLLESHCSIEQLELHLSRIEADWMGLTPSRGRDSLAASNLIDIWSAKFHAAKDE